MDDISTTKRKRDENEVRALPDDGTDLPPAKRTRFGDDDEDDAPMDADEYPAPVKKTAAPPRAFLKTVATGSSANIIKFSSADRLNTGTSSFEVKLTAAPTPGTFVGEAKSDPSPALREDNNGDHHGSSRPRDRQDTDHEERRSRRRDDGDDHHGRDHNYPDYPDYPVPYGYGYPPMGYGMAPPVYPPYPYMPHGGGSGVRGFPGGRPPRGNESKADHIRRLEENLPGVDDLRGRMAECAQDSQGSRAIQKHLKSCSEDEAKLVFAEIYPAATKLAFDTFGNYVIQKLLEKAPASQQDVLANLLIESAHELAFNIHGCRVIQMIADMKGDEYKEKILLNCAPKFYDMVMDQYGIHILLKIIDTGSRKVIDRGLRATLSINAAELAKTAQGNRLLTRIFDTEKLNDFTELFGALIKDAVELSKNQYGTHSIQRIASSAAHEIRDDLAKALIGNAATLAMHRTGYQVAERLVTSSKAFPKILLDDLTAAGNEKVTEYLATEANGSQILIKLVDTLPVDQVKLLWQVIDRIGERRIGESRHGHRVVSRIVSLLKQSAPAAPKSPSSAPKDQPPQDSSSEKDREERKESSSSSRSLASRDEDRDKSRSDRDRSERPRSPPRDKERSERPRSPARDKGRGRDDRSDRERSARHESDRSSDRERDRDEHRSASRHDKERSDRDRDDRSSRSDKDRSDRDKDRARDDRSSRSSRDDRDRSERLGGSSRERSDRDRDRDRDHHSSSRDRDRSDRAERPSRDSDEKHRSERSRGSSRERSDRERDRDRSERDSRR